MTLFSLIRLFVLGVALVLFGLMPVAAVEPVPPVSAEDLAEPVRDAIAQARARVTATADADAYERALAFGNLGDALLAHGFAAEARQAYGNARELAPTVFDWHYMLGMLELGEGQFGIARDHFNRARFHQEQRGDGEVTARMGDLDEARAAFQRLRRCRRASGAGRGAWRSL